MDERERAEAALHVAGFEQPHRWGDGTSDWRRSDGVTGTVWAKNDAHIYATHETLPALLAGGLTDDEAASLQYALRLVADDFAVTVCEVDAVGAASAARHGDTLRNLLKRNGVVAE
jgi:hypothetical protein